MTRTIKASEVKPGMTIRWDDGCGVQEITPTEIGPLDMHTPPATIFEDEHGAWRATDSDTLVAVLAKAQPEEPTPGVPDRIEEWPEDDTALRPYPWRDTDGDEWCWSWADNGWGYNHATFPQPFPECFPLTRVTDA